MDPEQTSEDRTNICSTYEHLFNKCTCVAGTLFNNNKIPRDALHFNRWLGKVTRKLV